MNKYFVILFLLGFLSVTEAKSFHWLSTKNINGMNSVVKNTSSKIYFPKRVYTSKHRLFAWVEHLNEDQYQIYIDQNKDCHAVKWCNLGYLQVEKDKESKPQYSNKNKLLTKKVKLHHDIEGFYTPAHALADYWPAQMQWQYQNKLYTLAWKENIQEEDFAVMANSVIDQLPK